MGKEEWLGVVINNLSTREAQQVVIGIQGAIGWAVSEQSECDASARQTSARSLRLEIEHFTHPSPENFNDRCHCFRCGKKLGGVVSDHLWPSSWPYSQKGNRRMPIMRGASTYPHCERCIRMQIALVPFGLAMRKFCICMKYAMVAMDWKVSYFSKSLLAPETSLQIMSDWFVGAAGRSARPTTVNTQGFMDCLYRVPEVDRFAVLLNPKHLKIFRRRNKGRLRKVPWAVRWDEALAGVQALDSCYDNVPLPTACHFLMYLLAKRAKNTLCDAFGKPGPERQVQPPSQ